MTLASIFTLGFLLGMRHAADADHIAAVATLATRSRSVGETMLQGLAWGTGHTLTLLLIGGAVLAAGLVVPERAAGALELAVGVMLVALGADVLYRLVRGRAHSHRHTQGAAPGRAQSHPGGHAPHDPARHHPPHPPHPPHPRRSAARALLVGMMHGMAGSAALIVLGFDALRSPALALVYIAVFGLGSMLGMLLLSAAIAVPLRWSSLRVGRAHDALSASVGFATLLLGCYIVFGSHLS